ncbi:hypothetical protein [Fusobacterium ulcerans]|uniref:hypothetical protein n=1 Tax=Fusobacterium ulcerans TaxID=861 RepID=UPI003FF0A75B
MNKKTTTTELKKEIRKRYEIGEDLITLALKYKINYGTLRNIASREKWEKGKIKDLVRMKELLEAADEEIKEREKVKKDYKIITEDLRSYALDKATGDKVLDGEDYTSPVIKSKEEAFLKRVSAIGALFDIEKQLYSIYTDKELVELKQEVLKYEKLREEMEKEKNGVLLD